MDLARLTAELIEHHEVLDPFLAAVEVAHTARREAHSGVSAGLEDTERPHPERPDEEHAPAPVHPEHQQKGEDRNTRGEGPRAQEDAPAAAAWPDVRDAPGHAHRPARPGFMRPFNARRPPSTYTVLPVMYDEASEARKTATSAISRGSATRCIGVRA